MALRVIVSQTACSRLGLKRTPYSIGNLSARSSPAAAVTRLVGAPSPQAFSTASSSNSSFSFSPMDWWRGRQERNEASKYKERLLDMAQKDKWTIGDMHAELKEVEKSWLAKIQDSAEVRQAKQMNATVTGIVHVMGADATDHDLAHMTRTQKLQAAAHSGVGVEQINMLAQQFQTMGLMHRVLKQRQAQGKPVPTTAEAMQSVMQVEGPKLMSPEHKKTMMKLQQKRMTRSLAQRRR